MCFPDGKWNEVILQDWNEKLWISSRGRWYVRVGKKNW